MPNRVTHSSDCSELIAKLVELKQGRKNLSLIARAKLSIHDPEKRELLGKNKLQWGLGFRPTPTTNNVLSSLIWYQGTNNQTYQYWVKSLTNFIEVYKKPGLTPGRGQNIFDCGDDKPPGPGQVCDVNVKQFHPCTEENYFMYHQSSPCIFLKLNKIYGWKPKFYTDHKRLPTDMPQKLKDQIRTLAISKDPEERLKLNTVWVTCEGENDIDKEYIGMVDYYPRQGFPGYFFPYENSEGYLSPLVAVHFKRPIREVLINIECRAWAININHHRQDKQGSVHIELLVD